MNVQNAISLQVEVKHSQHLEKGINTIFQDRIYPGQTSIWYTDYLFDRGIYVVKLYDCNRYTNFYIFNNLEIEYDEVSKHHIIKILHPAIISSNDRGKHINMCSIDEQTNNLFIEYINQVFVQPESEISDLYKTRIKHAGYILNFDNKLYNTIIINERGKKDAFECLRKKE